MSCEASLASDLLFQLREGLLGGPGYLQERVEGVVSSVLLLLLFLFRDCSALYGNCQLISHTNHEVDVRPLGLVDGSVL